jgi:hypothetical protein
VSQAIKQLEQRQEARKRVEISQSHDHLADLGPGRASEFQPGRGPTKQRPDRTHLGNAHEVLAERLRAEMDHVVLLRRLTGSGKTVAGPVVRQIGAGEHEVAAVERPDIVTHPNLPLGVQNQVEFVFMVVMPNALRPWPRMDKVRK